MIQSGGVWLPDGEKHLIDWMHTKNQRVNGVLTYQLDKQTKALAYCRSLRTAVDIGAHVGLWSMNLRRSFALVHAFEPVEAHRACFVRNIELTDGGRVLLHPYALGAVADRVAIKTAPTSSGDSFVEGAGDIEQRTLDEWDLQDVDFIKLDCEGYELFALQGARNTIERCRPVICVEQKPGKAQRYGLGETDAVTWLEGLGAKRRAVISGDYILTF